MPIEVICPNCKKRHLVPDDKAGKTGRCSACKTVMTVPTPVPSPTATRSAAEDCVAPEWKVGDVILNQYEVRQIHKGGAMGLVYRVHHRGWNLDLAVKSPRASYFATQRHKDLFVREAETWVNLGLHPHIVSCFYVRTLGGIPRVFAEYIEGGSLADWIDRRTLYEGGPERALERILDIGIQFAWGLQYAHEKSLIHQDVKPGNVMMTPDGTAKVSDFGLARGRSEAEKGREDHAAAALELKGMRAADQLCTLQATWGGMTPAFCSPEQASRKTLTRRTDIWSWAVSVLEMFTGAVTWSYGQAAGEVLDEYRESDANDPALPRMPEAVAALLKQCFARNPDDRPHDMRQVADALRACYSNAGGKPYPREQPEAAKLLADALNNRAVSLIDLRRGAEAACVLDQALALDPSHAQATYHRCLLRWRSGQLSDEDMRFQMEMVRSSHPSDGMVEILFAWTCLNCGDTDSARAALRGALPGKCDREDWQAAIARLEAAVRSAPVFVRILVGHERPVTCAALTPDGRRAISGSSAPKLRRVGGRGARGPVPALLGDEDPSIHIWDPATGNSVRTLGDYNWGVHAVALSADGRRALITKQDVWERVEGSEVWDVNSGHLIQEIEGSLQWISHGMARTLDPTSVRSDILREFATECHGSPRKWESESRRRLCLGWGVGRATPLAVSGDGTLALALGQRGSLEVWTVSPLNTAPEILVRPRTSREILGEGSEAKQAMSRAMNSLRDGEIDAALDAVSTLRAIRGFERLPETLHIQC